ncbi:MAG: GatB/YqeY domain-containing protein [Hyphomonadaceae bacterium]
MTRVTLEDAGLRDRLGLALDAASVDDSASVEIATLRLIQCAVRDRDVLARERGDCNGCDEDALQDILRTMRAQFEESAREFDEAGRIEEAEREREAIEIIQPYLPVVLKGQALELAVQDIVEDLEATRLKDMGRCMTALKHRYPGRIDTGVAGKIVREALG